MFDISSDGTVTVSETKVFEDQTGNSRGQSNKPYFYQRNIFEIDVTSSVFADESADIVESKAINTTAENKVSNENKSVGTIRSIYFGNDFISPELRNGFNLLEKSQYYIKDALENFQQGKRKEADECIMEFKTFLPELFCCRNISESFGAIINSIHNALSNMKGQPLSENQIVALNNLVNGLLREPAMSFEKAVDYVSEFEDADFEVESAGLEGLLKLAEMMNED